MKTEAQHTQPPEVEVVQAKYGWKFRCRYCRCWHYHGLGLGHRVAHCRKETSPYRERGYVLVEKRA